MRVIVIGTSGQLALELRRRPRARELELLPSQKVDIADLGALHSFLDANEPELVLNAAAYTAVDRAENDRERAFAVNASGPAALAEWCARRGAALVHVSTDYVFDGTKPSAYVESDEPRPLGVYGASKLAGERAIRDALERHVILRTSWVFSAHGHNFVKTMLRLAAERDELRVVGDQHGRPTAAADLADAMLHIASCVPSDRPHFGTFHFAGTESTTWHGLAQAVVDEQAPYTGKRPRVTAIATHEYPTPARRPASSVLSTEAFARTFALEPRPWRDGLREVVRELVAP